jgi:hypothetical protein
MMAARVRGDSTFAPSRHAAPQEKIDYTDPQVLMFNNLILLGFNAAAMEKKQGVPFGPTMFSNTGATRQCDCVVHFLLSKIFPADAASEFKSIWPILDRVQQREFKKAACGMLLKLQKAEVIPSQPQIRPSSLDTPNGDRFCMLLWAVSNHALTIEFKRRYPAQFANMPQLSAAPELARIIVPVALKHEQLLRSKFLKSAEHLANLDTQWAQVGEALGSTYRDLRSQLASLQEQAQAAGLDPLTAAEHDDAEPSELAHVRDWYQRFAADYSGQESARALVLDILNKRATSASLDSAKISAALGDGNDVSGPLDLSLVLDKWSASLGQLCQELGAHGGRSSSIASVAAQAQALEAVVEKRNDILGAVVKLRQDANDALSDSSRSLRRKIVNLGTHAATFPPSPSLRLAPSSPPVGDMFSSRASPSSVPVSATDSSLATPSTLRRGPNRLWPLESGCVAAAGALTPAGMQRLADSVRKAAKREAGVSSSVDVVDASDKNSEALWPQTSWNDVPHIPNRSESSPTVAAASLTDPVSTFIGSIFTPPESAVPRPVTTTLLGSLQDEAVQSTSLPRSRTKGESTFITTPEHLNKLESLQHGNVGLSSASLITSPVFPASLRKNSSPPPPPPKSHEQQDRPSTSFQRNAAASSKGPSFSMSSKQRLLSATAARNSVALREKAPASFAKEHHIIQEDLLAKDLAAKRRFALQQMSKNAIADEIADGIVGTGPVFNNNPFEIRKELPRTPEAPPILAHFSPDQSSSYEPVFSRTASAEKKFPAEVPPTASRAAVINCREDSEFHLIASAQHSPLASSHTQPSPAHQSAAAAYYAALLNPTPPRVTATAIDMASPLLKDYVPSHTAASSTPSVSKFNRSPVAFPPSPSRYAGDPFPLSPAAQFQTSHFDREEPVKHSMSAWGSARGTPDAASDPTAHSNAPNSASSASSWLNRRENSQSDVSNLPSPDLVATGATPWKACTCDLHFFNPQSSHTSSQPRPFPPL